MVLILDTGNETKPHFSLDGALSMILVRMLPESEKVYFGSDTLT